MFWVDYFSGTDGCSRWNWPSTSGASHNPFSLPTHSQEMDRRLKDNHRASPGSYTWSVGKIPYFFFHENSVSIGFFIAIFLLSPKCKKNEIARQVENNKNNWSNHFLRNLLIEYCGQNSNHYAVLFSHGFKLKRLSNISLSSMSQLKRATGEPLLLQV